MLDLVYRIVNTVVNKENDGYVSPVEINLLSHRAQMEIFESYFSDENKEKNRDNKGLINTGYSNLPQNVRNKLSNFTATSVLSSFIDPPETFILPVDLYILEDNGVSVNTPIKYRGNVISEVERSELNYLIKSESKPTKTYPVYELMGDRINVYPPESDSIRVRYIRKPKVPNWTYEVVTSPNGNTYELHDPTNPSFQDLELHVSEISNVVDKILIYLGINLSKQEISELIGTLGQEKYLKNNS